MEKTSKKRPPSRCREWERNRRNKFNDAIFKLGETIKSIVESNNPKKENGDTQYPKIEIVLKAIVCLENCNKERMQLKAEILALQVTLDDLKNKNNNKKDASTQAHMILRKKKQCIKPIKIVTPKAKRKVFKEKAVNNDNFKTLPPMKPILPKYNITSNKAPENTIFLLPASPYIFPQRPVLYPTVPPTIILVNPNQLNKSNDNIINKNTNDITKTTMVNILPISAYSRPLSATKTKKSYSKSKIDKKQKKPKKKTTEIHDHTVESNTNKESLTIKSLDDIKERETVGISNDTTVNIDKSSSQNLSTDKVNTKPISEHISTVEGNIKETQRKEDSTVNNKTIETTENKIINDNNLKNSNSSMSKPAKECKDADVGKLSDSNSEKDRNKENKLPNILDTTLCENVVDTGNSRLELAEELLAASPTAAFLMSFPLVSGNRADSPTEETHNIHVPAKDTTPRRSNVLPAQTIQYSDESISDVKKPHCNNKIRASTNSTMKPSDNQKYLDTSANLMTKQQLDKPIITTNENPFLPMPPIIATSCGTLDSSFGLDFDCNITKPYSSQSSNFTGTNNIFYKSDPFNTVKNAIYSTSSITSSHDFNNIGLYPCAMEKYNTKSNTDDNLIKIGSSRLTYDIDLGWSHKSLDFVNCSTTTNTFTKDNILTTVPMSASYSSSYNPFNPEFHVPLVSNTNKKDNTPTKSFPDITNFYSQANMWSEEVPFYTSNNVSKSLAKQTNYLPAVTMQLPSNTKQNHHKQLPEVNLKPNIQVPDTDKFTKKSPTKTHINWMTSEVRSMHRDQNYQHLENKNNQKTTFVNIDNTVKKPDNNETNYFPISMHSFPTHSQSAQEEFQVWPATRGVGTAEITIEPPPINLPTLVGDLALGPHDKKKNMENTNKTILQPDVQNCGNFLSVTQLMNRSSDNMSRYQGLNMDPNKSSALKQHTIHNLNESNRKLPNPRENHQTQTCYNYNDNKSTFDNSIQFSQQKPKHTKTEKGGKIQKNSYSAEALIRGGGPQKVQDPIENNKFLLHTQKYNDYNTNDSSVAQVSHFPSVIDYSDNNYTGQQFSGTALYNSTTNTLSNSFYTNFMPSNSNIMTGNFASGPFASDFIDYNQPTDCNFTNHKYEDFKMKNNSNIFNLQEKSSTYKSSRRESTAKHKLDCSKKESNKKYQNKRAKISNETEEWSDTSALLWQNKGGRRHGNFVGDDLTFPNYNQMPSQYQSEFFNSHLMSSNVQSVGPNVDRSLASFPITSRANFNLSTIFPEITMKVQS